CICAADILYVRSVSTSVVAILIGPHCRPYRGKDLCRIHERLDISFLSLKVSVAVHWFLSPILSAGGSVLTCVCAHVSVCVCASRRNSAMRDTESREL